MDIKQFVPPIIITILKRSFFNRNGWFGNFSSWNEANRLCERGYASETILKKVIDANLKVKNGEYAYERDTVLFDKIQYSTPVLAGLLFRAACDGQLTVVDFGGSLGAAYWQNRKFFTNIECTWIIIEQDRVVNAGKKYFENEHIFFYSSIEECFKFHKPNVFLFSTSLQYVEKPYETLHLAMQQNVKSIILEMIPMIEAKKDRLTIQVVPPWIYKAKYPSWFFSQDIFLKAISNGPYSILEEFESSLEINVKCTFKSYILVNNGK